MTVLVLDVDGVTILGHPEGGPWDQHLFRDFGIDPDRLQNHFFEPHWPRIEIGDADLFDVLREVWPLIATAARPDDFVAYWFAQDSRLNTDLLAQVDAWRARGGHAYLATVQEHHRARYLWTTLGLQDHFDGLLYSADLGAKKPNAAFFERAMRRLPIGSGQDIIFLDDRPENVAMARQFAWQAIIYTEPDDLRRALRDAYP